MSKSRTHTSDTKQWRMAPIECHAPFRVKYTEVPQCPAAYFFFF